MRAIILLIIIIIPTLNGKAEVPTRCQMHHDYAYPHHVGADSLERARLEAGYTPGSNWGYDMHWCSQVLKTSYNGSYFTTYWQYANKYYWLSQNCDSYFLSMIELAKRHIDRFEDIAASRCSHDDSRRARYEQLAEETRENLRDIRNRWRIARAAISEAHKKSARALLEVFSSCARDHGHSAAKYQATLVDLALGQAERAFEDIKDLMNSADFNACIEDRVTYFLKLGEGLLEEELHQEAVYMLTQAINEEPENSEARFLRSVAFFGIGEYDLSAQDFEFVELEAASQSDNLVPEGFTNAFLSGLRQGGYEGLVDFVPSLYRTVRGMGRCLWATVKHPLETEKRFSRAVLEATHYIAAYIASLDSKSLKHCNKWLLEITESVHNLSPEELGNSLGHFIGKYGVDALSGGALVKSVKSLRDLKRINRICNLETLTACPASKSRIVEASIQHQAERQAFFRQTQVRWDAQGKHMPGHRNYLEGRSKITIPEDRLERLLAEKAGGGKWMPGKDFGPGFKERVDFGEIIGEYIPLTADAGIPCPTTMGIIHYSKRGAHIVPCRPI